MDIALPAWLGALCGMIVAAAIYVPGIRLVERQLRDSSDAGTSEQRGAFENRLSVVRRLILALDVAIFAALGYWIGNVVGGKIFGATVFGAPGS
jgi:hypothetical protein